MACRRKHRINALSLFSCIGVGEYYLKRAGVDVVVATDIDSRRCRVHGQLYPSTKTVCGDITSDDVKRDVLKAVGRKKIQMIISTPPCQGMSSVGKNKGAALSDIDDSRNYLILETFPFIDSLSPDYVIFENVPQMLKVKMPWGDGERLKILEILEAKYGGVYDIKCDIFNSGDYGVPQTRERVFIRLCRKGLSWHDPKRSEKQVTLREAIGNLPSIEPGEVSALKNHWARLHPTNQIEWLRHTPTGRSAFMNDEHYPRKSNGDKIKGYLNCYKRMSWDQPSHTVTMRNEIMSSQDKVHPGRSLGNGLWSDARVLTLRELLIVMSLPGDLELPDDISDTALRQFIGEGVPPLMMKKIIDGIEL